MKPPLGLYNVPILTLIDLFNITLIAIILNDVVNDVVILHLDFDKPGCALQTPCDINARCSNSSGSFECVCEPGFAGNGSVCVCKCLKVLKYSDWHDNAQKHIINAGNVFACVSDILLCCGFPFYQFACVENL